MKKNLRKIFAVVAAIALIGAGIFFVMTPKFRTIGIVVLTISAVLLLKVVVRIVRTIRWKLILNKLKGLFKNRRFWRIAGGIAVLVVLIVVILSLVKSCDRKTVSSVPSTTPETSATTTSDDTTSVDTSDSLTVIVNGNNSTIIIPEGDNNKFDVEIKNEDVDNNVTGDSNKIDNTLKNEDIKNDITGDGNKIDNSKKDDTTTAAPKEDDTTTIAPKDEPKEDDTTTIAPKDEPKEDDTTTIAPKDEPKEDPKKEVKVIANTTCVYGDDFEPFTVKVVGTKSVKVQQAGELFKVSQKDSDDGLILTLTPGTPNATGYAIIYTLDGNGNEVEAVIYRDPIFLKP